MRPFLAVVVMIAATAAPAADFQFANVQGPNFVALGDPIDYHIVVAPGSTTAQNASVSDPLPTGIEYVEPTLTCYVPSGSCTYTPATRTVSYSGDLPQYNAGDILFSASTSGLASPAHVDNQVTFAATGFNTVVKTRTTVVYSEDEWPVYGETMRLSETDGDWYAGESTGVAWNPHTEVFSAVWIRTDLMSSQRYLQTRTIDPTGSLGDTQQVNQVAPGEEPYQPSIACSSVSGQCLVAWTEVEPVSWQWGIRTRLLGSDGVPIGNEAVVVEGGGHHTQPRVVYNPDFDEFLVVYSSDRDAGVVDVSAQLVRASDGALLGAAVVESGTDFDRSQPKAAYLAARDDYLIAYTCEDASGDRQVRAKVVADDLVGVGTSPEVVIASPPVDDYAPAVGAEGDGYLVAWARRQGTPAATQIRARRVSGDGVPIGSTSGFLVNDFAGLPSGSVTDVRFAGEQGFLVGWVHNDSSSPTGADQHGRYVELGDDQPAYLEFPALATSDWDQWGPFACRSSGQCLIAVEVTGGVDARFITAWRVHGDGFEDGSFAGWDAVVGAVL